MTTESMHLETEPAIVLCIGFSRLNYEALNESLLFVEGTSWLFDTERLSLLSDLPLRLDSDVYIWRNAAKDLIDVQEMYKLRDETILQHAGSVNLTEKRVNFKPKWERRGNLRGIQLLDSTKSYAFMMTQTEEGFVGTSATVMGDLAQAANVTFKHQAPKDGLFGDVIYSTDANGSISVSYTGPVADLMNGEADISSIPIIYTAGRRDALAVLPQIDLELNTLIVKVDAEKECQFEVRKAGNNFGVFSQTLTDWAWIGCYLLALASVFTLTSQYLGLEKASFAHAIQESSSINFIALIQRSNSEAIQPTSLRFTCCVVYLSSLMLYSCYTGGFTASFMDEEVYRVPQSYQEVIEGGFELYVAKNTFYGKSLVKAGEGTIERRMMREGLIRFSTRVNMRSAILDSPCTRLGFSSKIQQFYDRRLRAVETFEQRFRSPYGVFLPEDSQFKGLFAHLMVKLLETGLLEGALRKWKPQDEEVEGDASWQPVGIGSLRLPSLICGIGVGLATLIASMEAIVHVKTRRKR